MCFSCGCRRRRSASFCSAIAVGVLACLSGAARGGETAGSDTTFTLGEIVVTGHRSGSGIQDTLTSVDVLGADIAQRQLLDQGWEILGRLPGVLLTDFNQGTTSGKFSMRGFNGEGEINAVKLLIDGIPSNNNDGNMPFIDQVFALDIASVELVRGTSDPRFGLHNIAGNATIVTRVGGTYLDSRISTGSYATRDVQLAAGLESGAFTQNYLAAWRDTSGYRDHAATERVSLAGKWFYNRSERASIGAIVRYYDGEADEPGYLTRRDARDDADLSYAFSASDGGKREMGQASVHLDIALADSLDLDAKAYFNRFEDRRFVKFSAAVSQQERVADEEQRGLIGALRWQPAVSSLYGLAVEIGGDLQQQDNISERYLTRGRVRATQTRDQSFDLDVAGAYAQAVIEPTAWLKITPAYRVDRVEGDFTNRLTGGEFGINRYRNIEQPKLGVAITPLDAITLYANWGRTYQIGLASGAYLIPPRVRDIDASINEGWELGLRYAPGERLEARIALWQQKASGEVKRKLNDPLGDFDNLGETRREGVDVQVDFHPVERLDLWLAYAWQRARIETPDPAAPQFAGNRIDHVPAHLGSGGVDFAPTPRWRLSLWSSAQSNYELDSSNARGSFGDYALLNAEAAWQIDDRFELSVQLKNLTDTYFEYVWWDGAQSLHSPGDGRAWYLSLRTRL
jgi:iron complex outermembrane recepter protein